MKNVPTNMCHNENTLFTSTNSSGLQLQLKIHTVRIVIVLLSVIRCYTYIQFITMTSSWAHRRLKSPASWLITQPFIKGTDQRKHQSSTSLAFVRGSHRWPVDSPHKWPVTRKMFPFDDVIMCKLYAALTHWGRVTYICVDNHGHNFFWYLRVVCSVLKHLADPMMDFYWFDPREQIPMKFELNYTNFNAWKLI